MKEDYEVHVFFAKDTTDVDPLEIQRFWIWRRKKFSIGGLNLILIEKTILQMVKRKDLLFFIKMNFEKYGLDKMTNQKSIKQELMEVQQLILENQYLQDKYPEKNQNWNQV